MDLVIALDSSESLLEADPVGIPYHNWQLLKNLTSDVIGDLRLSFGKTRVGFLTFANDARRVFHMNAFEDSDNPLEEAQTQIRNMEFVGGSTNTREWII